MKRHLPLIIDAAFCLVLLPTMLLLLPLERWQQHDATFVALLVAWLYAAYFLFRHAVVPMLLSGDRTRQVVAAGLVVVAVGLTWWLTQYDLTPPPHGPHGPRGHMPPGAQGADEMSRHASRRAAGFYNRVRQAVWFLFVTVAAFGTAVGLLVKVNKLLLKRQELELARDKAELALYKAQINPHFLFNTLNTLYGLMLTDQPKAEDAFLHFTSLMKYQYENAQDDTVPFDVEVDYIDRFIKLERFRLSDLTTIDFNHNDDGSVPGATIAPMLLITFVENAFKYGASSHTPSHIAINLAIADGKFKFHSANTIVNPDATGAGIGIANCRRRLELLYSGHHKLECGPDADKKEYHVTLIIDLL